MILALFCFCESCFVRPSNAVFEDQGISLLVLPPAEATHLIGWVLWLMDASVLNFSNAVDDR